MSNRQTTAYRAANHFGLGVSSEDLAAAQADPRGWLEAQLAPESSGPETESSQQLLAQSMATLAAARRAKQKVEADPARIVELDEAQQRLRRQARSLISDQTIAQFEHAANADAPFRERLVRFWSNHFSVSVLGRPQLAGACLPFENEAIRTGVDGHFADLLVQVVSHPVMLMYLDNAQSMGPDSPAGRRLGRGLNENLAREILELHTLGVDGGYRQEDVKALAGMLTGWTVGNARFKRSGAVPGAFTFAALMHQGDAQRLLGKRYPAGGQEQAVQALRDLARHPATARFIAEKLSRHFVSDQPPQSAIEKLTHTYLESDGHLPSLHAALLDLPQAWGADERKLKTPYELLLSAHRGLALPVPRPNQVLAPLRLFNHLPFTAPSPAGWPDDRAHWGAPSAMTQRVEWGIAFGSRVANGIDARASAEVLVASENSLLATSLRRAESTSQALGLLLAAPDFQWR